MSRLRGKQFLISSSHTNALPEFARHIVSTLSCQMVLPLTSRPLSFSVCKLHEPLRRPLEVFSVSKLQVSPERGIHWKTDTGTLETQYSHL